MIPRRAPLAFLAASLLVPAVSSCVSTLAEPITPALPVHAAETAPRPGPVESIFPGPGLVVEKVEGAEAAHARAAFASVSSRVRACAPGPGGVIRLTLDVRDGHAQYTVVPAASNIEPFARRCVLETLSTVDVDGIWSRGSPSERPPGFTAHLRVQW